MPCSQLRSSIAQLEGYLAIADGTPSAAGEDFATRLPKKGYTIHSKNQSKYRYRINYTIYFSYIRAGHVILATAMV
jgi:hypothetical protein